VTAIPPTLTDAARYLDRGEATSRALSEACLARIEARDDALRAFITVEPEAALRAADASDARRRSGAPSGVLDGMPIAVKDNLAVAGRETTMGSALFRDHVPEESAAVVDRLDEQGAVRLGATNLHEFALGVTTENPHFGICRNPWDPGRTPGGSSGGSAVAVAAGMALAALGSDTSGSIRIPAAACGIVGLKPTYGRVSSFGCYPEAWSLDHVGVLTRTAADAAVLLDALSGHDPRVASSLALPPTATAREVTDERPLRIGVEEAFFFDRIDPAVEQIVRAALEDLARAGAELVPVALPSLTDAIFALTVIDTVETTAFHHDQLRLHGTAYGDDVRLLVECGGHPLRSRLRPCPADPSPGA
jgi:aspartyl-tRNA(Asn)/glutamyl-tRNA(Gln) amidotransferase subunit A